MVQHDTYAILVPVSCLEAQLAAICLLDELHLNMHVGSMNLSQHLRVKECGQNASKAARYGPPLSNGKYSKRAELQHKFEHV